MSGSNEDYYGETTRSPLLSPFPSPFKGKSGENFGHPLPSPGHSRFAQNDSSLEKITGAIVFQSFDSRVFLCSLNYNEEGNDEEVPVKPLSPVPDNVEEDEQDNDLVDGGGVKTLAQLKSYPSDPLAETSLLLVVNDVNTTYSESDHSGQQQNSYENENDGYESPASSQGSMQSVEYLARQAEAIERNTAGVKETFPSLDNVIPKHVYKVIEGWLEDSDGLDRLLSFATKDILSTSYYTGAVQRNSAEADSIKRRLESLDRTALMGIIGRIMMAKYADRMGQGQRFDKSTAQVYEQMDTGMTEENILQTDPLSGRLLNTKIFENAQNRTCTNVEGSKQEPVPSSSALALVVKTEINSVPPNVPDYGSAVDAAVIPSGSKRKTKRNNQPLDKVQSIAVQIPHETWNNATDQLRGSEVPKQIEKIGQVFFDAVFDGEEKANCTLSGKRKLSSSGEVQSSCVKRPFDTSKVRFLRFAIAFIISQPGAKNSKTFLKAINNPQFKDLEKDHEEILKKKVLTEYAYRERQKLLAASSAAPIVS